MEIQVLLWPWVTSSCPLEMLSSTKELLPFHSTSSALPFLSSTPILWLAEVSFRLLRAVFAQFIGIRLGHETSRVLIDLVRLHTDNLCLCPHTQGALGFHE